MTLLERAWLAVSGRSQAEMCRSVVYLRRARAKEPPIRPVPRIVARVIRCGDMCLPTATVRSRRRRKDNAETQRAQSFAEKGAQPKMAVPPEAIRPCGGLWLGLLCGARPLVGRRRRARGIARRRKGRGRGRCGLR